MTLFSALYRRLVSDSTISGLVGTRVFDGFGLIETTPQIQLDIDETEDSSLDVQASITYSVAVQIVADNIGDRETLRRAVKAEINRQSWTDSNIAISSVLLTSERSTKQSISGDVEQVYYVADQSYNVLAKEF